MNPVIDRAMNAVDNMPNLVKVVTPGLVDQVLRVVGIQRRVLILDNGPDIEEWEQIKRLIFLKAPMEQKSVNPRFVGTTKEWTLLPDEVPSVDVGKVDPPLKYSKKTREYDKNQWPPEVLEEVKKDFPSEYKETPPVKEAVKA